MDKKEYIKQLAISLCKKSTTMTVSSLAENLNQNNFKTNYGTEYEGTRGTYTLIHATYDWLVKLGQQSEADCVARAFTKADGTYAYD